MTGRGMAWPLPLARGSGGHRAPVRIRAARRDTLDQVRVLGH
jgi:hypothetical protein